MNRRTRAADWIRPEIQSLRSYHVPPSAGLIKLDAMENPYSLPADLDVAWRERLAGLPLNRYPDPGASGLVAQLRDVMGIPDDAGVLLGNGSDELIQMICMGLAGTRRVVLAPAPSFVMYEVIARACAMPFIGVPLNAEFGLDMTAMREAIAQHRPAVIFLAWPNNPTGNLFAHEDIATLIELAPGLVVIDEAYQPFAGDSFLSRLREHRNLVVMRTLSKVGLAGLRLGVLAGDPEWLGEFDKLRLPYNINSLTQATASFALTHWDVFERQIALICGERERVYAALRARTDLTPWPSRTNFILLRTVEGRAEALHQQLLDAGILVKLLHRPGTPLQDCLRVTIGTPAENDAFLAALGH